MGRRRRRSRGGGISRRRFLVGGLLGIGGASILGGTQAFSQVDATRAASIQTAGDENALLGVDTVSSVQQGDSGVELVTLTNNTDHTLSLTIALDDPSQGNVSPAEPTLSSANSTTVFVDVASDSPTGADALPFMISAAAANTDFSVSMERSVAVVGGPSLTHYVQDRSGNSSAIYDLDYNVENVPTFDRIEVFFENLQNDWASDTLTSSVRDGQLTYDTDGGTYGNPYRITIEVYGESDDVVLDDVIEDSADGGNPGDNPPIRDEDDPILESFVVNDDTLNNSTELSIEYEVSQLDHFGQVSVTFLNQNNDYATEMIENEDAPTGTVTHTSGDTEGDTYEITVEVHNDEGLTVDSGSIEYEAGSADTASWP